MERAEYRKILEDLGYEIDSEGFRPWNFWVRDNPSQIRYVDVNALLEKMHAVKGERTYLYFKQENHFPGGKFRYMQYGKGGDELIEDYADKRGRAEWKDYVVIRDKHGNIVREGPKPFRNASERKAYEQLTGQRHRDPTETDHRRKR